MSVLITVMVGAWLLAVTQPDGTDRLESLLAEAHQAQARSDYRAAGRAYEKAVAIRPDLGELWSNLGLMRYESHEYSQAEEAFRRALGINKSLFVPNLFLGLDLLELKRPREAVGYLLAAEKSNPRDIQTLLALGRAFHVLSEPARSQQWYQRAADLSARTGEAWYGLGLAYFGVAESAGAKLVSAFSQSAYVAELTAEALAEQGRLAEAMQAYRALLDSNAQPVPCSRTSYGFVLLRHGDHAQAEEQFDRDLDSCPAAKLGKASVFSDGGNPSKDDFDHSNAVLEMQRTEPELGKMTEQELQQFASDAFFSGDFRAAAMAGDRLRQQYPSHAVGWYWAVRAYQKLGVAALGRAGEVEPDSPRMHALLGDVYQRRKMFREAEEEYSKMLALEPDSVAALAGLAGAYLADGQLVMAETTARKALGREPADSEMNLLISEILVAQHKYAEAEPYLQHSLHVRPDLLPRVHALLGRVYARTGRSKEAINELTQGLANDEDGSVYYQLARLYQSAGEAKAAAAAFEKSQQIRAKRNVLAQDSLAPVH